jgi:tRNA A37 threonylcarbamoyladenosine modification protein TsaB
MALGRGAPLVGAGSLEAMAFAAFASGAAGPDDLVVSALDAKKNELFLAGYDAALTPVLAPCHVPLGEVARVVLGASVKPGGALRVVGEVAASVEGLAPFVLRAAAFDLPDAAAIGRLALGRIGLGSGDPELVEPVYVRPPDAKPMTT